MEPAIDRQQESFPLRCEDFRALADLYNARYFDVAERASIRAAPRRPRSFRWPSVSRRKISRAACAAKLSEKILARNNHLATGFIGSAYLMPALSDNGLGAQAAILANNRTYPSWGYMAESGATTIWERWNSDQEEATKSGMNSFNHFTFGSVSEWYFEYLLGIRPLRAGFQDIEIAPHVKRRPGRRAATTPCMVPSAANGTARSRFTMTVEIPANTSAVIVPPVSVRCGKLGRRKRAGGWAFGVQGGCRGVHLCSPAMTKSVPRPALRR
jgi:hypothetical protein